MEVILDMGSGNTCRNDYLIASQMIKTVAAVDNRRHRIVFKWQLFEEAGINLPLDLQVFRKASFIAGVMGYQTTASVFDFSSLKFLMEFPVPFVKLANRRDLDWLIDMVPRGMPIYRSVTDMTEVRRDCVNLACVSKYPADCADYISPGIIGLCQGISDHTVGTELVKLYQPAIWEKHFVIERSSRNPDGGAFAITPVELKQFLEEAA